MVKSTEKSGSLIESALKKMGMLAISRYSLTVNDILAMLYRAELDVIRAHWEQDKDGYYETRIGQATTNAKYAASGASYNEATGELTATMSPVASVNDVGKMVTFFDVATGVGVIGTITDFVAGSPTKYVVSTFFPIPTLASVQGVTVMDTLLTGDMLRLTDGNEIWTPEKLEIYDLSNQVVIKLVPNEEFNNRKRLDVWKNGSTRWARYMKTAIEFAAGLGASQIGTLKIAAYWLPPRTKSLNDTLYCGDARLGEVERALMMSLFELKTGQPAIVPDATREEKWQERMKSGTAREELTAVR